MFSFLSDFYIFNAISKFYTNVDRDARKCLLALSLKRVKLAEDIKLDVIADQLEDYSGADITALCRDAALMSMRKAIKGKTPAEIKELNKEDIEKPVTMDDFSTAIQRCTTSIEKQEVERHKKWIKQYGSY